jgi:hypothetical protein
VYALYAKMLPIEHFFFESSIISIADIFWVFLIRVDFYLKKQGCILSINDLNFPNFVVIILAEIQKFSKTFVNTFPKLSSWGNHDCLTEIFALKLTFLASSKFLCYIQFLQKILPHMVEFLRICTPGKNRSRKKYFSIHKFFISITVHVDLTNFLFGFSLASFTLGSK